MLVTQLSEHLFGRYTQFPLDLGLLELFHQILRQRTGEDNVHISFGFSALVDMGRIQDAQVFIKTLSCPMTLEEASNSAAAAKEGQILVDEALPDPLILAVVIILFSGYTFFTF